RMLATRSPRRSATWISSSRFGGRCSGRHKKIMSFHNRASVSRGARACGVSVRRYHEYVEVAHHVAHRESAGVDRRRRSADLHVGLERKLRRNIAVVAGRLDAENISGERELDV